MATTEMMLPVNGIDLCVETFGERTDPAVLLITAATGSMDWWDDEFCRRLAAGGRYVIRYDHRDTGRSTSFPAGKPPYSGADLAHDALGILDALNVHRAHVVGLSMGGALAQRIAVERAHRLLSLTLMSTTPGPPVEEPGSRAPEPPEESEPAEEGESDAARAGDPEAAGAGGSDATGADTAEAGDPEAAGASRSDATGESEPDLAGAGDSEDDSEAAEPFDWSDRRAVVDRIAEMVRALGGAFTADEPQLRRLAERVFDRTNDMAAAQSNHYLAEPGPPFRARLAEIRVPTLILHGTQDPIFGPEHPEALAAEIPGARLIWLDGVGHEYPPNAVWPTVLEAILGQGR